jgi:site-specific recombinase XerD
MSEADNLQPLSPQEAITYYVESRQGELAQQTLEDHEYRLKTFTEWCERNDITNLNDLTLRDVHEWKRWKRTDNGDHDPCNVATMHGQVSTVRMFLKRCVELDAVDERVAENVRVPTVGKDERSNDEKLSVERAKATMEYLRTYEYASARHVAFLLAWRIPLRRGSICALDLGDWNSDEHILEVRHRPPATPLKNGDGGERDVNITASVGTVLDDFIEGPRVPKEDPPGRRPLLTTREGRPVPGTIQRWMYAITRPCEIGEACPHDEDPATCEAATWQGASKCPSSRPPHAIRTGSVTAHRNAGTPRPVLSDRADASEDVLEEHYDKAGRRDRARRRRDHIPDSL